jgi:hypothetical protein
MRGGWASLYSFLSLAVKMALAVKADTAELNHDENGEERPGDDIRSLFLW